MVDLTVTYEFNLPEVGGDINLWGGYLNENWEAVEDLLDGTTIIEGPDIQSITLSDSTDNTKKLQFDLDDISTGTTRTITVPNANITLVGTTNAQTIQGKNIQGSALDSSPIGDSFPSTGKFTRVDVDNVRLDGNTVSTTDTNGNLLLSPNGTGDVRTDNLSFNGNTIATTNANGNLLLSPNGTGDVRTDNLSLNGNTIATTNTNGNLVLAPNGTGDVRTDNLSLNGNTIASTNTNGNIVLAPDGDGTVVTDNLSFDGNTIAATDTDGSITLLPDGSGTVKVDNLSFKSNTVASTNTDGNITIDPNGTGSIRLDGPVIGSGVQDSRVDGTSGVLLLVGAFGIGELAAPNVLSDIDSLDIPTGFHRVTNSTSGTFPIAITGTFTRNSFGRLRHERYDDSTQYQEFQDVTNENVWFRVYRGGSWRRWRTIYNTLNISGLVERSSGENVGALFETASNTNGRYTKYADGSMVAYTSLTTSAAGTVTWTFPSAFAAAPAVVGTSTVDAPRIVATNGGGTTTSIPVSCYDTAGSRVAIDVKLVAHGRWF